MRPLALALVACAAAITAFAADYSYTTGASNGPARWGQIQSGGNTPYAACASTAQSPVSLPYSDDYGRESSAGLGPLAITERAAQSITVVNDGAVLSLRGFNDNPQRLTTMPDPTGGSGSATFSLSHIDVHVPAEHAFSQARLDGEMQMHFMRNGGSSGVATDVPGIVVDVMLTASMVGENAELRKLLALGQFPTIESATASSANSTMLQQNPALATAFKPGNFLPARRDYVTYDGSITRPPCTRNMRHIVLLEPVSVSVAQLTQLASLVFVAIPSVSALPTSASVIAGNGNARPLQSGPAAARLFREVPNPNDFPVPTTGEGESSEALLFGIIAIVISGLGIAAIVLAAFGIKDMTERLTDAVTELPLHHKEAGDASAVAPTAVAAAPVSNVAAIAEMGKPVAALAASTR